MKGFITITYRDGDYFVGERLHSSKEEAEDALKYKRELDKTVQRISPNLKRGSSTYMIHEITLDDQK